MPLLSSRSAHLCNDGVNRMPPPLLQCGGLFLGAALCFKKKRRRPSLFLLKSFKSCRSLFSSSPPPLLFSHSTSAAGERDVPSSNLPFPHLSPPPLVPRPPPSSTHAVIQWKISAVNLSVYGFAIVATPRTLVFFLGVALLGWITDFSFFLLF